MAQKDYVSRGRSAGTRRKKKGSRNKGKGAGASGLMIILAIAVLIAFAACLWFLTHHEKASSPISSAHKSASTLPPKPEERWRYIKELENKQTTITAPREPVAGGEIESQSQLTSEQRQLLEQMKSDMRQQPTQQLNEVPWNGQVPVQKTPPSPAPISKAQSANNHQPQVKQPESEKTASQQWIIQCGSFKGKDQAESVRASLAFEGFDSRVTSSSDWNRVITGPYSSRTTANSTLTRLKNSGHSNCILLPARG